MGFKYFKLVTKINIKVINPIERPKLNKTLELLHENLAVELLNKVKSGEATASEMNVARQFLKDNGIEGLPVDNSPLKALVDELPFDNDESYGGTH